MTADKAAGTRRRYDAVVTATDPESPQAAKARGAFYTPPELARFMAGWAIRNADDRVLEPSCGDGAFIATATERFAELDVTDLRDRLVGIERAPVEAAKAAALSPTASILTSDFFDVEPSRIRSVDAVLGNPPYIRYHGFTGSDRAKSLARAAAAGVTLSRLASSWAAFVVHSTAFLAEHGRVALVLPAELLHTDYGRPVREFLVERFGSIVVVAFDRPVFGAQVDAVALLASDDDHRGLRVVRVPDERVLDTLDVADYSHLAVERPAPRWSRALDPEAGALYTELERSDDVIRFGAISSVDIGFVSGADGFFVLSADRAEELGLPASVLTPTIRRPGDIPGLLASRGDVRYLFDLTSNGMPDDPNVLQYIARGESDGIHERYKSRVRHPWYAVPLPRHVPDAFLPYMSHHGPRLVVNDVRARSTNLVHGVTLGLLAPAARALAVAMASSLTLLSAEIEGRSYGGGVLKLETKEAERLLVPKLDLASSQLLGDAFEEVHELVRQGNIGVAATVVDDLLGLDHAALWRSYQAFRIRRALRRRSKAAAT